MTDQPDRPQTMAEVPAALRPGLERIIREAKVTLERQGNHPPPETSPSTP